MQQKRKVATMDKTECPKCQKKMPPKRSPVKVKNGEYLQPMTCKNCGHVWEMRVDHWILSRVGQKVAFKPPAKKQGTLKDRAVVASANVPGKVPYWDVVDRIQFEGDEDPEWIRISYYLTDNQGLLTWGGQTSITEPVAVWKTILLQAAREKKWFRDLLQDVMNELEKGTNSGDVDSYGALYLT
jgi:hypothetical protein